MAIYKLGDIGEFKGGISNLQKNRYDKGINFINYMDILNNLSIDKNVILRKYNATNKDISKYGVKYGDVFFTASSETINEIAFSSVYLSNKNAIFNGFSKRFRFKHSILNPRYAEYFFRSSIFRNIVKKYATGYTRYNISQNSLNKIKINIPNLKIQKQIIDIIEPYEKLFLTYSQCVRIDNIKNTKKDLKNLIDIIEPLEKAKNLMIQTQNKINLFFKVLPLKKEKIKFNKIGIEIKNKRKNLDQLSAKVIQKRNPMIQKIEKNNTYKTNLFFVPTKTLLINTIRPYLEKFAISPINCDANGTLFMFKVNENFQSLLLANIMKDSFWKKIIKMQQGTKMPIIKKREILDLLLHFPIYKINNIFDLITKINKTLFIIQKLEKNFLKILIK